jgi:hypothetical protein
MIISGPKGAQQLRASVTARPPEPFTTLKLRNQVDLPRQGGCSETESLVGVAVKLQGR